MKTLKLITIIYIALSTFVTAQSALKKVPFGLPAEAKFFNGKWYHVYPAKMDWKNAKQKCESLGGRLVTIPDEATWSFVKTLTNSSVWLGASDEVMEGDWVWVTGLKVTFTKWAVGQPNNKSGEDNYMVMIQCEMHDYHKKWDFIKATPIVGFICEWDDRK